MVTNNTNIASSLNECARHEDGIARCCGHSGASCFSSCCKVGVVPFVAGAALAAAGVAAGDALQMSRQVMHCSSHYTRDSARFSECILQQPNSSHEKERCNLLNAAWACDFQLLGPQIPRPAVLTICQSILFCPDTFRHNITYLSNQT